MLKLLIIKRSETKAVNRLSVLVLEHFFINW